MTWHKVDIIDIPKEKLVIMHDMEHDSVKFAMIKKDSKLIEIRDEFISGSLSGFMMRMNYEDFKQMYGNRFYWKTYHRPFD